MKRRKFLQLAGGAAVAWPIAASAQEQNKPVIGLLSAVSFESYADRIVAFRQGLKIAGFVEGQNVLIEYRSADGRSERLRSLADDLVGRNVAVIVALASSSPLAAHEASSTIPIV